MMCGVGGAAQRRSVYRVQCRWIRHLEVRYLYSFDRGQNREDVPSPPNPNFRQEGTWYLMAVPFRRTFPCFLLGFTLSYGFLGIKNQSTVPFDSALMPLRSF